MTIDRRPPSPGPKKAKRPHPARSARILSTGAAASLTFGMIAGLAVNDSGAAAQSPATEANDALLTSSVPNGSSVDPGIDPGIEWSAGPAPTAATVPTTIVVIRRIHVVPAAVPASAPDRPTNPAAFSPGPATRAPTVSQVASNAATRRTRTVARTPVVRKARVRVRKAKPASRAS